jgi:hypothetical protein
MSDTAGGDTNVCGRQVVPIAFWVVQASIVASRRSRSGVHEIRHQLPCMIFGRVRLSIAEISVLGREQKL